MENSNKIHFVGLNSLDSMTQEKIKRIVNNHFDKLERNFKNIEFVKLTLTQHKDQGNPRYEAHFMISGASSPVIVDHIPSSIERDPIAIVRTILSKAQKELERKFI